MQEMSREKTYKRVSQFSKCVKVKKNQYDFIKKEMKRIGFKTQAGTLDLIINAYKNEKKKDNECGRPLQTLRNACST